MQATPYVSVPNGTLAVQLLDLNNGSNPVFPTAQLITFNGFYCTVLIVDNNGTLIMVPYNESLASSMSQNFFNATGNQTLPNRDWVRLISAAIDTQCQLFPNSDTSTAIFSFVGYLSATPYVQIDPTQDTKFLLTQQFNMTDEVTISTTYNLSSAYTIFAFWSSEGLQGAIYFDRVIPVTLQSNSTATNSTTNSTTSNSTHVTSGVSSNHTLTSGSAKNGTVLSSTGSSSSGSTSGTSSTGTIFTGATSTGLPNTSGSNSLYSLAAVASALAAFVLAV